MWFQYEPSQFSVGQTAQSQACSIMEKPHTGTGLHDCLKILLLCFRARMSGMAPNFHTWLLRDSCWGLGRQNRCAYGFYKQAKITCFSNFQTFFRHISPLNLVNNSGDTFQAMWPLKRAFLSLARVVTPICQQRLRRRLFSLVRCLTFRPFGCL